MTGRRVLALILAGGRGERLHPLTRERSKPAVPFGGRYRIVDFVLSNFVNSGLFSLYVLVQYKSQSLIDHLRTGWRVAGLTSDHFIIVVPPQQRWGEQWYRGTADAVYQNLNLIRDFNPDLVAIFGADHIYRMDVSQMLRGHLEREARVTVAALPVPIERASGLGIIEADADGRVSGFEEKPREPRPMPANPAAALSSMGNYLFDRETLVEAVLEDARRSTDHDFGRTIIPELVEDGGVFAYDFLTNAIPGISEREERGYWRDVGTIDAYWRAHMDLLGPAPRLDLDNPDWPIRGAAYQGPSTRIIRGAVEDALLGEGTTVRGGRVRRSVLGRGVVIEEGAEVEDCILMDYTVVGEGARLRRVIADRYNLIAPGSEIGHDRERDARRHHVDESGIVVLPRGQTRFR